MAFPLFLSFTVDKEQEKSHMNAPAPSPVRQTKKALNGLIFTSDARNRGQTAAKN